jgi:putative PIN family toxin of toxin-antitoxin system
MTGDSVVIDTNVLVSALITPEGKPARVLDSVLTGGAVICCDSRILFEYERVLTREKFGINPAKIQNLLIVLTEMGISMIAPPTDIAFTDESDRKFYEVALASDAVLVTGNLRHYPKEPWIVSPSDFLRQ